MQVADERTSGLVFCDHRQVASAMRRATGGLFVYKSERNGCGDLSVARQGAVVRENRPPPNGIYVLGAR